MKAFQLPVSFLATLISYSFQIREVERKLCLLTPHFDYAFNFLELTSSQVLLHKICK